MANPEHLALLKSGVTAWNRWRAEKPEVRPDLTEAYLRNADLQGADLQGADLFRADLKNADLSDANLMSADLITADLTDADLRDAFLAFADLWGADLKGAELRNTVFDFANFVHSNLRGADLRGSTMEATIFANVDFSEVKGLESVSHVQPSTVGTDTLALTLRGSGGRFTDEQIVFFEGAGVPPTLLEYFPDMMVSEPLQFYSCFISYNTEDEGFATRLNEDLNAAGVRTWKWNVDSLAGRDLEANIYGGFRVYDKMILVCSVHSLTSGPVQDEIRRAIDKEHRLEEAKAGAIIESRQTGRRTPVDFDTDVLIPITLDGYVFEWESPLAVHIKRKYIPDFSKARRRGKRYIAELEKLIAALNAKSWPIKALSS